MKGTKTVIFKRLSILLFSIMVISVIVMWRAPKLTYIELKPEDEEENFQISFTEGTGFGMIHLAVQQKVKEGKITQNQYLKFEKLSSNLAQDFTVENQEKFYRYAAKLLKMDLRFYYHQNVNEIAFMEGFAVETSMYSVQVGYNHGLTSKEEYEKIQRKYEQLINEASEELVNEYLNEVYELLLKMVKDEPESSSFIIFLKTFAE